MIARIREKGAGPISPGYRSIEGGGGSRSWNGDKMVPTECEGGGGSSLSINEKAVNQ